jgi:lipopolysaccharide export system protein LptC
MATAPRFSRTVDRLTVYLPVILMGLLTLGTYGLLRTTPQPGTPERNPTVTHNADYFMRKFSLKTFDAMGRLKTELQGQEIRHFPDTDTLEIDQVYLRSYDDEGHLTTATSDRGLSNGDGSEVQLMGHAVVVRDAWVNSTGKSQPTLEIRSDFLHAITDTERLKTHLPVVITRGLDTFTADSMDYDNLNRLIDLKGRVHGVLTPTTQP